MARAKERYDWIMGGHNTGKCWRCGQTITRSYTGRPRRYCSNACRQAEYRKR
jgi:hypothetical protein